LSEKVQVYRGDLAALRACLQDALDRAAQALQDDNDAQDVDQAHAQLRTALASQKGALQALLQTANAMGGGGA